jgi:hypothetical protein
MSQSLHIGSHLSCSSPASRLLGLWPIKKLKRVERESAEQLSSGERCFASVEGRPLGCPSGSCLGMNLGVLWRRRLDGICPRTRRKKARGDRCRLNAREAPSTKSFEMGRRFGPAVVGSAGRCSCHRCCSPVTLQSQQLAKLACLLTLPMPQDCLGLNKLLQAEVWVGGPVCCWHRLSVL